MEWANAANAADALCLLLILFLHFVELVCEVHVSCCFQRERHQAMRSNEKVQKDTKSRKKEATKTQHDRSNRSNKRNKGQVHHTLAAAFVGVGQILFLKMQGLTCLFSFRTHHHRKGCHGCCLGCQSVEKFLFFSTSLETCNRKSFENTVRTSP